MLVVAFSTYLFVVAFSTYFFLSPSQTGASQLVIRSTHHTVKSCEELTVVSDSIVSCDELTVLFELVFIAFIGLSNDHTTIYDDATAKYD